MLVPPVVEALFPLTRPFTLAEQTVIAYDSTAKLVLGEVPTVEVYYLNTQTGAYVINNNPNTVITFTGDAIVIDHGGAATGFIKVY